MISCSSFSSTMQRDVPGMCQPERTASSKRSSRCRISIGLASFRLARACQGSSAGLRSALPRQASETLSHRRRDHTGDISAQQRDLFDAAGADEHQMLAADQTDGFQIGCHGVVCRPVKQFPLEVGDKRAGRAPPRPRRHSLHSLPSGRENPPPVYWQDARSRRALALYAPPRRTAPACRGCRRPRVPTHRTVARRGWRCPGGHW